MPISRGRHHKRGAQTAACFTDAFELHAAGRECASVREVVCARRLPEL